MTQTTFTFDDRASQTKAIIEALLNGRKLTPLDALNEWGCFRLGARIYDAKKLGYNVITEMVKTPNGKRIASYRIGD